MASRKRPLFVLLLFLLLLLGAGAGVAVVWTSGRTPELAGADPAEAPSAPRSETGRARSGGSRRERERAERPEPSAGSAGPGAAGGRAATSAPSAPPEAPRPAGRLTGRIVDDETGGALPGARLLLVAMRADGTLGGGFGGTAGGDGAFDVERPKDADAPGAHAELRVALDGYEPLRMTAAEESPVVRLRRRSTPALPGRVVGVARDGEGRPLTGALIVAGEDELRNNAAQYVVADAGGAFVMEGVPAGHWTFSILDGRRAEAIVPEGGEARVELVVPADPRTAEERIHGTNPEREGYGRVHVVVDADGTRPAPREVVLDGLPDTPGATVRASFASLVPRLFWRVEAMGGEARFPQLTLGTWKFTLSVPGRPAQTMRLGVGRGDGPLRVTFDPE